MESPHFTQLAATLTVFGVSGWIRTTALLRGDLQSPAFDRSATLTFGGCYYRRLRIPFGYWTSLQELVGRVLLAYSLSFTPIILAVPQGLEPCYHGLTVRRFTI